MLPNFILMFGSGCKFGRPINVQVNVSFIRLCQFCWSRVTKFEGCQRSVDFLFVHGLYPTKIIFPKLSQFTMTIIPLVEEKEGKGVTKSPPFCHSHSRSRNSPIFFDDAQRTTIGVLVNRTRLVFSLHKHCIHPRWITIESDGNHFTLNENW